MKKLTLSIAATIALSMGAFGQGSLTIQSPADGSGVNTATTNVNSGTGWYTGSLTLEVYYAPASTTATNDALAINGASGSSTAALALLAADSSIFTLENLGSAGTQTSTNVTVSDGSFGIAHGVALLNIPTSASGVFVLVGIDGNLEGLVAFANGTGGNLAATPTPGLPATLGWDLGGNGTDGGVQLTPMNMYLTPVPEPASLALAGLGGLSMLLFRRRNK